MNLVSGKNLYGQYFNKNLKKLSMPKSKAENIKEIEQTTVSLNTQVFPMLHETSKQMKEFHASEISCKHSLI